MLNFSQIYSPLIHLTILPRVFINDYIFPAILAGFISSTAFTALYCCTILCCAQEEYIYPLTIHQYTMYCCTILCCAQEEYIYSLTIHQYTMYCCIILCCAQEEYIYPLTIHQYTMYCCTILCCAQEEYISSNYTLVQHVLLYYTLLCTGGVYIL